MLGFNNVRYNSLERLWLETVAPDALVPELVRKGILLCDGRHVAVNGGIESGHLGDG
jgi:hypothetical protein